MWAFDHGVVAGRPHLRPRLPVGAVAAAGPSHSKSCGADGGRGWPPRLYRPEGRHPVGPSGRNSPAEQRPR